MMFGFGNYEGEMECHTLNIRCRGMSIVNPMWKSKFILTVTLIVINALNKDIQKETLGSSHKFCINKYEPIKT